SEYIANCDRRMTWLTGFDGTAGDYNTPEIWEWLDMFLPPDSDVGFDPFLLTATEYIFYERWFFQSPKELRMYSHEENLVDNIWHARPVCPDVEPIFILDQIWSGNHWANKIEQVRHEMRRYNADMLVLHGLDESAWLYNLRGIDIPYNPVYFSYTIVTFVESVTFIQSEKVQKEEIRKHLNLDKSVDCMNTDQSQYCVRHYDYEEFLDILSQMANLPSIRKVWISDHASYAIYSGVPEIKRMMKQSPVLLMKSIKNNAEITGMIEGYLQDSIALNEFFHWLEEQVHIAKGDIMLLSEMTCVEKLFEFRSQQPDFIMESFPTISAFGPNAAVVHYKATTETNRAITDTGLYLLDSGAQFRCGATTDSTRTVHYGIPTRAQREAYTRVLMGHIELALSVFPERTYGSGLDSAARKYLWYSGLDYGHGTGHGVGACLNAREGPIRIGKTQTRNEEPLYTGMFISNEPGYYEYDDFGVRLENVFLVSPTQRRMNYGNQTWMTFLPVSYVPFQNKLIMWEIMSPEHIDWLNVYNQDLRFAIGDRLYKRNQLAYHWMINNTMPIYRDGVCGAVGNLSSVSLVLALSFVALLMNFIGVNFVAF
ncbi:xaa-Pro aminopeptidase 1-like, partial [Saccoglossus kowalevskii]